jgi:hypothetical protein
MKSGIIDRKTVGLMPLRHIYGISDHGLVMAILASLEPFRHYQWC